MTSNSERSTGLCLSSARVTGVKGIHYHCPSVKIFLKCHLVSESHLAWRFHFVFGKDVRCLFFFPFYGERCGGKWGGVYRIDAYAQVCPCGGQRKMPCVFLHHPLLYSPDTGFFTEPETLYFGQAGWSANSGICHWYGWVTGMCDHTQFFYVATRASNSYSRAAVANPFIH